MVIGIPREVKDKESRVACTPGGAQMLVTQGHQVQIQKGAGDGSGYSDMDYSAAGATVVAEARELYRTSAMILKVKEPVECEFDLLQEGQTLFTYLHLAVNKPLAEILMSKRITAFAYESVQTGHRFPLLEPMSEIAGRMSVIVGANYLSRAAGGRGVLLSGVPGVLPAKVVVLGGGTAGLNAARMAAGMGADVTILEVNQQRMQWIDQTTPASLCTCYSNEQNLKELLPHTDLLIGAVLLPGARAPRLIHREMLRMMKPGTVFVDIAIDQGGCADTSRPTTHANPTYIEEDVIHYCVTNMPGAYARTATQALTHTTMPYVSKLAQRGWQQAVKTIPELAAGLNVANGKVVHPIVKSALEGSPAESPSS